jgi:hypothetical protein
MVVVLLLPLLEWWEAEKGPEREKGLMGTVLQGKQDQDDQQ